MNFNILGCPAGSIWICVVLRVDRFFSYGEIVAWSFVALVSVAFYFLGSVVLFCYCLNP